MKRAFIEDLSPFLGDGCYYEKSLYRGFISISGGWMLLWKEPLSRIYLHFWGMDVVIQEAFIEDLSPFLGDGCYYGKSLYRGFISISGGWMLLWKEPLSRIYLHFWGMDVVIQEAFIEDLSPFLEDGCC